LEFDRRTLGAAVGLEGIAVGEMDGDGALDIVAAVNDDADENSHLRMYTELDEATPTLSTRELDVSLHRVAVGDIVGDASVDVTVSYGPEKASTLAGYAVVSTDGAGQFFDEGGQIFGLEQGPYEEIAMLELVANEKAIVVAGEAGLIVSNGMNSGVVYDLDGAGSRFAANDFDGDGDIDIAVVVRAVSAFLIATNDGDGGLEIGSPIGADDLPGAIASGDLDGDDAPDLVIALPIAEALDVRLNTGDGGFVGERKLIELPARPLEVAVGDLNEDGMLDIAVAVDDGTIVIVQGDGSGGATCSQPIDAVDEPGGLVLADMGGDTRLDMVASGGLDGVVAIFVAVDPPTDGTR